MRAHNIAWETAVLTPNPSAMNSVSDRELSRPYPRAFTLRRRVLWHLSLSPADLGSTVSLSEEPPPTGPGQVPQAFSSPGHRSTGWE